MSDTLFGVTRLHAASAVTTSRLASAPARCPPMPSETATIHGLATISNPAGTSALPLENAAPARNASSFTRRTLPVWQIEAPRTAQCMEA